jgi:probable phosphoglycerate mutase
MNGLRLIEHGQSEHQVTGMLGGWHDLPLTALGRTQAARVAERLAAKNLPRDTVIYSSDLSRASETASIIAGALGFEVRLKPGLREINNGKATGFSIQDGDAIRRPRTEPIAEWVAYEGAESWRDMVRRVFACMDRIDSDAPKGAGDESDDSARPIIVGHGGSLGAIVRWWLGPSVESSRMWEFWFDNCSYSVLTLNSFGERQVAQLNDSSHLAG